MAINVQIPSLGESVSEAVLLKWHKNDGDMVKADEPLCELETDKANTDLNAPAAGVFKRSVPEGTKVRIGQTVATIDPDAKGAAKPSAAGSAKQTKAAEGGKATATAAKEELSP